MPLRHDNSLFLGQDVKFWAADFLILMADLKENNLIFVSYFIIRLYILNENYTKRVKMKKI